MVTPELNREQILATIDRMADQLSALRKLVAGAPPADGLTESELAELRELAERRAVRLRAKAGGR